jgi:hypothetical protein
MNHLEKTILPILLATVWISISEFVRNSFFLHDHWIEHYKGLGLTLQSGQSRISRNAGVTAEI